MPQSDTNAGVRSLRVLGLKRRRALAFAAVADKFHAALVPFLLEGVGGHPELNQPDRIHPNPAGHAVVAENVWKIVRPLL